MEEEAASQISAASGVRQEDVRKVLEEFSPEKRLQRLLGQLTESTGVSEPDIRRILEELQIEPAAIIEQVEADILSGRTPQVTRTSNLPSEELTLTATRIRAALNVVAV